MAEENQKPKPVWKQLQTSLVRVLVSQRGWNVIGAGYWRNPHAIFVWPVFFILSVAMVALGREVWLLSLRIADATYAGQPDDINKLLLALAGIIGAPFVVWRVLIAAKANSIAEASAAEKARIDIQNLQSTLLTKAVEQLGAMREEKKTVEEVGADGKIKRETITNTVPNTEVRLGAIYALEKLARDSEELHWPIMEILCAYVRNNAKEARRRTKAVSAAYEVNAFLRNKEEKKLIKDHEAENLRPPSADVQAALTVIGRRPESRRYLESRLRAASTDGQEYWLDLSGCHLAGAKLDGLHFQGANLTSSCLEDAMLQNVHLEGASLLLAHLEGATLHNAHLEGAILHNAHLEGASLHRAHLTDALLDHAYFSEASRLTDEMIAKTWGDWGTKLPRIVQRLVNDRWLTGAESKEQRDARISAWTDRRKYWLAEAEKRRAENK